MGKHEGTPEESVTIDLSDNAPTPFDTAIGEVQREAGFLRIEDAMGTLTPDRKRHRIAVMMTMLSRAAALGVALALVVVGGGVATAHPASAAVAPRVSAGEYPPPFTIPHRTRFGKGIWADLGSGYVGVSAPLNEYLPGVGWVPSSEETVSVQEFSVRRGRWVTRARFRTNTDNGAAHGMVLLGGGVHTVRVIHFPDVWTLGTVGTTRRVFATPDPLTD